MAASRRSRWIGTLISFAVVGAVGLTVSAGLLSNWTRVRSVEPAEAERAFSDALAKSGGGTPYVEIAADGTVTVHREQESSKPFALRTLHVVARRPDGDRLVEIAFPFWFVRLKLSGTLNLGTLTTLLAGDWSRIDLRVTANDLRRRGPGLILDHRPARGGRLLLWTE